MPKKLGKNMFIDDEEGEGAYKMSTTVFRWFIFKKFPEMTLVCVCMGGGVPIFTFFISKFIIKNIKTQW